MINLFDLYKSLKANVNPSQGGHIRPSQNFEKWCNEVQEELFEDLVRQWEKNRVISDKLSPFLRSVNIPLVPLAGKSYDRFAKPADYRSSSSARFIRPAAGESGCGCKECEVLDGNTGNRRVYVDEDELEFDLIEAGSTDREAQVRILDNQRLAAALTHRRKKPSADSPIISQFEEGFKVYPRGLGVIVFDYFRWPRKCHVVFTVDSSDVELFDSAASTHLEWNDDVLPEFLARLEMRYGTYTRDEVVYQSGQIKRKQTTS